jgi:hypothetical protein
MPEGIEIVWDFGVLEKMGVEIAQKGIHGVCIHLRNEVLRILTGQRTGRIYRVPGFKKKYQASAPGEPPASRSGAAGLRGTVYYRVLVQPQPGGAQVVGEVIANKKYATWLEKGTRKMAARPYLMPVLETNKDRLMDEFAKGAKQG